MRAKPYSEMVSEYLAGANLYGARIPLVAAAIGLTPDVMRNRLHSERTSFKELLDKERGTRAYRALVENPRRGAHYLADELGYSEPKSVYRAFPRWFGCSLGRMRYDIRRAGSQQA